MVTFNDADDFFQTAAEGGNAFRLQDINGIGPATEDKIMSVRDIQSTDDVKQMSADELADKANISRSRAKKAISGLGGNPAVSKRSTTGSVSAAGIRTQQGDFRVEIGDLDKARARNDAMSRSETAVRVDERRRAPITTNYEQWKEAPGRWDFPGVDTPTQDPKAKPKDYKKGGTPETTEVDEESEVATGNPGGFAAFPEAAAGSSLQESFEVEMAGRDIPASPEEVRDGVGASGMFALGGLDRGRGGEEDRASTNNLRFPDAPVADRANLAQGESADLAFSKAERERKREQQSGMDVPMQPYESRSGGPPSQIGPYELITDTQEGDMRTIAFEEPERERTVAFQRSNPDLEGPDASVDVWWGENAETVFEGDPNEAFETFIGELEDRAERNKQRTGNESNIQSREEERVEAIANLFGV